MLTAWAESKSVPSFGWGRETSWARETGWARETSWARETGRGRETSWAREGGGWRRPVYVVYGSSEEYGR
jgi:hypothetical protein